MISSKEKISQKEKKIHKIIIEKCLTYDKMVEKGDDHYYLL